MKTIVLCADDYGQNQAISQAIIQLLEKKRLTATSCMTTVSGWKRFAKELVPFKNQIDMGLHFNLTENNTPYSLNKLLVCSHLRCLDKSLIESELHAQLDAFLKEMGQYPDFIDGHQHIHHLPVVRDILLKVYDERLRENSPFVRSVYDPHIFNGGLKGWVIQWSGAKVFRDILEQAHIPHNSSFSGIYSFADSQQYSQIFPQFLAKIHSGGIIMCHPGLPNVDDRDAISNARAQEFSYFNSEVFLQDLANNQVRLGRFKETNIA